jgi:hypothetical protein
MQFKICINRPSSSVQSAFSSSCVAESSTLFYFSRSDAYAAYSYAFLVTSIHLHIALRLCSISVQLVPVVHKQSKNYSAHFQFYLCCSSEVLQSMTNAKKGMKGESVYDSNHSRGH